MNPTDNTPHWYCIQTRPKSEHIATAHLKLLEDVEVFCPRIRFQKNTKRGKVWFNEALFPGYTFVKLDLGIWLRAVNTTNAVLGVVRFGNNFPPVPDAIVEEELWGDPGGATSGRTHSRALSSFTASSTSMILEPARSCMTRPEVTIGLIPSSMHVPRFEAIITRAQ